MERAVRRRKSDRRRWVQRPVTHRSPVPRPCTTARPRTAGQSATAGPLSRRRSAAPFLRSASRLRFREFVRRNDKFRGLATVGDRGHVVFVPARRAISKEPAPQTRAISGGRDDSPTFRSLLSSWLRAGGTGRRGLRLDVPFGHRYRGSVFVRGLPGFWREQRHGG